MFIVKSKLTSAFVFTFRFVFKFQRSGVHEASQWQGDMARYQVSERVQVCVCEAGGYKMGSDHVAKKRSGGENVKSTFIQVLYD